MRKVADGPGKPRKRIASAERPRRNGRHDAPYERNLYRHLADRLGRDIVGGVYPADSLLPSVLEMCERFSVSRTALREAYSVLSAKALIVARPKIGTRVRPKSDWNLLDPEVLQWHLRANPSEHFIDDLFALRQMVEPEAAALAAAHRSSGTLDRITEAFQRMERFKNGAGDLIGADLDFHTSILEATGNPFLAALGGLIHAALEGVFKLSWRGASGIQDNRLHQHGLILDAIRARDPHLSRKRMAELLRDSIGDVQKFLEERGAADAAAKVGVR